MHPGGPALGLDQGGGLRVVDPADRVLVIEIAHFGVVLDQGEAMARQGERAAGQAAVLDGGPALFIGRDMLVMRLFSGQST